MDAPLEVGPFAPGAPGEPALPGAPAPAVTVHPWIVSPPDELTTRIPELLAPPEASCPVASAAIRVSACTSVSLIRFEARIPVAVGLAIVVTFVVDLAQRAAAS